MNDYAFIVKIKSKDSLNSEQIESIRNRIETCLYEDNFEEIELINHKRIKLGEIGPLIRRKDLE